MLEAVKPAWLVQLIMLKLRSRQWTGMDAPVANVNYKGIALASVSIHKWN
jgi:hypothetical protein